MHFAHMSREWDLPFVYDVESATSGSSLRPSQHWRICGGPRARAFATVTKPFDGGTAIGFICISARSLALSVCCSSTNSCPAAFEGSIVSNWTCEPFFHILFHSDDTGEGGYHKLL